MNSLPPWYPDRKPSALSPEVERDLHLYEQKRQHQLAMRAVRQRMIGGAVLLWASIGIVVYGMAILPEANLWLLTIKFLGTTGIFVAMACIISGGILWMLESE